MWVTKEIPPGAYELSEIAQIIKEQTNNNVIIEVDKNAMKCKMKCIKKRKRI